MKPRNILKTALLAALAAAPLIATAAQPSSAQTAAAASKAAANGPWAFVTREAFGVKTASELNGAHFCALANSPSADAAAKFFEDNDLTATHVEARDNREAIEKYQKYDCDVLVVAEQAAASTADSLKPEGEHLVLPDTLASLEPAAPAAAPAAPAPRVTPAPAPRKPTATVKKKKPARKKTVRRKPRCSAIRYAYSSGGTCSCAGGRVFTGRACVRPRWY